MIQFRFWLNSRLTIWAPHLMLAQVREHGSRARVILQHILWASIQPNLLHTNYSKALRCIAVCQLCTGA